MSKRNRSDHIRRKFLGSVIRYDGNDDGGITARFNDGSYFDGGMLDLAVQKPFQWRITVAFTHVNGNFERTKTETFKAVGRHKFNDLGGIVHDLATEAALEMPDGYTFDRNTWSAKIIG